MSASGCPRRRPGCRCSCCFWPPRCLRARQVSRAPSVPPLLGASGGTPGSPRAPLCARAAPCAPDSTQADFPRVSVCFLGGRQGTRFCLGGGRPGLLQPCWRSGMAPDEDLGVCFSELRKCWPEFLADKSVRSGTALGFADSWLILKKSAKGHLNIFILIIECDPGCHFFSF